jgi:DNA-binding PadR family transcriptional regulator
MHLKHTQHNHPEHNQHMHGEHGFRHRHDEGQRGPEDSERHHGRGGGHRGQEGHGRSEGREGHGRGPFGGMHGHGGPRGRARRGEARYILLDALRGGPKHGYEIIKSLEERSGGQYAPSPGTVYPTMQLLEDLGLVRADKDAERRVFHLTDAGLADLETHAQEIADFWERFGAASPNSQPEASFVREELQSLERTVWEGLRGPLSAGNMDTVRAVRTALERCRNEIREIVTV